MLVLKSFLCWWKLSDFNAIILTYSFVLSFEQKVLQSMMIVSHSHQRLGCGHEIVGQIETFSTGDPFQFHFNVDYGLFGCILEKGELFSSGKSHIGCVVLESS